MLTRTRSQISDGASAVILARRSWAEQRNLKPIAQFLGTQVAGCEPDEMGIGPIQAITQLYKYTGLSRPDIDIFELNEAFASQTLTCIEQLGLDLEKVNPNGGAIALGHPTGATGSRQLATLLAELTRRDQELGVISMCARFVDPLLPFNSLYVSFTDLVISSRSMCSTGIGVAAAFARE